MATVDQHTSRVVTADSGLRSRREYSWKHVDGCIPLNALTGIPKLTSSYTCARLHLDHIWAKSGVQFASNKVFVLRHCIENVETPHTKVICYY